MPGFIEIILRTCTAFLLLWAFVHVLGKQTIFQRTYHLYIASITMGTLAGNLAFNINIKFLYFILSIFIMGVVIFILNYLAVKNHRYRKWIAGEPTILINKGKIMEESINKIGFPLASLKQALRSKDIFNMDEVECAILEVDGSLSVLKKPEYQPVTKQDLNLPYSPYRVPIELIMDGEILYDNLSNSSYPIGWLMAELEKRNLQVSEVSYAVLGSKGNLYIDLYKDL